MKPFTKHLQEQSPSIFRTNTMLTSFALLFMYKWIDICASYCGLFFKYCKIFIAVLMENHLPKLTSKSFDVERFSFNYTPCFLDSFKHELFLIQWYLEDTFDRDLLYVYCLGSHAHHIAVIRSLRDRTAISTSNRFPLLNWLANKAGDPHSLVFAWNMPRFEYHTPNPLFSRISVTLPVHP